MKPVKLKLENFMCFSKIELDFSTIQLACLTGGNGSGKTSIIDALTWALWEVARSSNEKLIKVGSNNMKVDLEISINNLLYKIIRSSTKHKKYSQGRKASTSLEIFSFNEIESAWHPISKSSLEETQKELDQILNLNYTSFINSVYIRQRNTDSFLLCAPEKRRDFLNSLIGFEKYDEIYLGAKEKIKKLQEETRQINEKINQAEIKQFALKKYQAEKESLIKQIQSLQKKIDKISKEKEELDSDRNKIQLLIEQKLFYKELISRQKKDISRINEYIKAIQTEKSSLEESLKIDNVIKQRYKNLQSQKEKLSTFDSKELEYHQLKDRLLEVGSKQLIARHSTEHEHQKICQELDEKMQDLKNLRKMLTESKEIQKNYSEYLDIKNKLDNLDKFMIDLRNTEIKIGKIQNEIDRKTIEIETKKEYLSQNLKELNINNSEKEEFIELKTFLESEIKQYDKYTTELEKIREEGIAQREIIFDKNNKNTALEQELERLNNKINHMQGGSNKTECPTCYANVLSFEDIAIKFEFEIDNIMIQIENNNNDITVATDKLKIIRTNYKEKKKYLAKKSNLIFQLAEIETCLKNIELQEEKYEKDKSEIEELNNILQSQSHIKDELYQMDVLQSSKKQLQEVVSEYYSLKIRLKDLEGIESKYQKLKEIKIQINSLEAEIPFFTMSKRVLEKTLSTPLEGPKGEFSTDIYVKLMNLDYNLDDHLKLRHEINDSKQIEYDYIALQFAYKQNPILEKNLSLLKDSLKEYQQEIFDYQTILTDIDIKLSSVESITKNLEVFNSRFNNFTQELNQCNCSMAVLNDRIENIGHSFNEIKKYTKELEIVNAETEDYIEIAKAFSKQGIQDEIIQNSIQFIEKETNTTLGKLSDNKIKIAIKPSQKNKTGEMDERLDIYIIENHQPRNFELYGGGESFKIEFAIRIAFAKLIAKKRKIKLQTLIIDDGFAYQDQQNQQKFASLINAIQDDFEMVLLITHNEDLTNLFPSRIEIFNEFGHQAVRVVA